MILLQVFIDDYLQQCIHKSERFVAKCLFAASKDLLRVIEEVLGCTVHLGKADVIASSKTLLSDLR